MFNHGICQLRALSKIEKPPRGWGYLTMVSTIALLLFSTAVRPVSAQTWPGPTFKEFSGVNQIWANNDPMFSNNVLGWERHDFDFGTVEPSKGVWNTSALASYQTDTQAYKANGAMYLPVLDYMASWAGPNNGPPNNVADWTTFVQKAVDTLHPLGVNYFQIWNEASPTVNNGFYYGTFDDYMNKIHFPAATTLHTAGCKVVWGGWPDVNSPQDFISMMDKYNAWSSIDVVDIHYFHWWDLETIRTAAVARGYTNLGYWQSENGWTTDPLYICDEYPGALYWALTHGVWNGPDKFKYFYFAGNGSGNSTLYTGSNTTALSAQGLNLTNLANLLGGGTLSALSGVTGTGLTNGSWIVGFNVGAAKSVIAVGMTPTDYTANKTTITLTIPISKTQIVKAERVDLTGNVIDETSALVASGNNTTLAVSTRDAGGSNAASWNNGVKGTDTAVFYVRLTL